MSYYSDIAVIMRKEKYNELVDAIHAIEDEKLQNDVWRILKCSDVKEFDYYPKFVLINIKQIKWYLHFPEIAFLDKFFDKLTEEEKSVDYKIIRIGEENEDIEEFGYNEGIELIRKIKINI